MLRTKIQTGKLTRIRVTLRNVGNRESESDSANPETSLNAMKKRTGLSDCCSRRCSSGFIRCLTTSGWVRLASMELLLCESYRRY